MQGHLKSFFDDILAEIALQEHPPNQTRKAFRFQDL